MRRRTVKSAGGRWSFLLRNRRDLLSVGLVAAASALVLLYGLGRGPVYLWDEARVAINALEMMRSHDPFVLTYHGEPDFWNPKPPLTVVLTAISMSVGGLNETALRLPSAVAAIATVFSVFFFTRWVSGSRLIAVLAALILLGTGGYIEAHVARSAEPDSLLVFFLTAATFCLACSFDEDTPVERRNRWFYWAGAALACAMLTKGIAAFLMVPGYAIALLYQRKLHLLNRRAAWLILAGLIALAIAYWGGRELAQPGFTGAVTRLEIDRSFRSVAGAGDVWYDYIVWLIWPWVLSPFVGAAGFSSTASAFPWSLMLPLCAVLAARSNNPRVRDSAVFLLCSLLALLLVLSAAVSKLVWYIAPAYPLIAVLTALGIGEAKYSLLAASKSRIARAFATLVVPATLATAAVCIGFVVWKSEQQDVSATFMPGQRLGYFVREVAAELPHGRPIRVFSEPQFDVPAVRDGRIAGMEAYDGPTEFYIDNLQQSGLDIRLVQRGYQPKRGDVIVGCGSIPRGTGTTLRWKRGDCFEAS